MSEFKDFRTEMQKSFKQLQKKSTHLFKVDVSKEDLWDAYLDNFNEDERQSHNCNCCKSFIRQYGNVVGIVDGKVKSIWNFTTKINEYNPSIQALDEICSNADINNVFLSKSAKLGTESTVSLKDAKKWYHFQLNLPDSLVDRSGKSVESLAGIYRSNRDVFVRSCTELTTEAIGTVMELIESNSIYRGAEFKKTVKDFAKFKKEFDKSSNQDNYSWVSAVELPMSVTKIRNSAIGTLLIDLSNDMELEKAVKRFEDKVSGTNYKRTKTLSTPSQVKAAEDDVVELGLSDSLSRRFAKESDIDINQVLFADSDAQVMNKSVFGELIDSIPGKVKELKGVQEIGIEHFIRTVLPTATSLEVLLENKHSGNFMNLLTAQNEGSPSLFKYGNNFSWNYTNGVADSMKERVKSAGGRVDGVLRFTHSWNHENLRNSSLMDLHVFLPGSNIEESNMINDYYGNEARVGWNRRNHFGTKGVQDVDYTSNAPDGYIPVENITFPSISLLKDGKYICKIHNWQKRYPNNGGGKAEIEFDGQLYQYEYPKPLENKEWLTIAIVTLNKGVWSIEHKVKPGVSNQTKWGLDTNKFHKVNLLTTSPNFWVDKPTGNKHYFFFLEDAKTDETARGFFNEMLRADLYEHRRTFEMLASKMKVEPADRELSGLGFSSTLRNDVTVRVKGQTQRLFKIKF